MVFSLLFQDTLLNAQTDLAIRIWTILVPIRLKKPEKNGFGPFSYKFFVCIRVGLRNLVFSQEYFGPSTQIILAKKSS